MKFNQNQIDTILKETKWYLENNNDPFIIGYKFLDLLKTFINENPILVETNIPEQNEPIQIIEPKIIQEFANAIFLETNEFIFLNEAKESLASKTNIIGAQPLKIEHEDSERMSKYFKENSLVRLNTEDFFQTLLELKTRLIDTNPPNDLTPFDEEFQKEPDPIPYSEEPIPEILSEPIPASGPIPETLSEPIPASEPIPEPIDNFITLTPHQKEIAVQVVDKLKEILNTQFLSTSAPAGRMVLFEGAAGTGKTYTTGKILKELVDNGWDVAMCSPTHEALNVIRGTLKDAGISYAEDPSDYPFPENLIIKTIASFLNIKMNRDLENGTETFEENKRGQSLNCDILCIDECSMISKELIHIMVKKLGMNFKAILFIGDEPQLPSPSDGEEGNGLFHLPYKYSLTEVVRQDGALLNVAWWLRDFIVKKDTQYLPSNLITEQLHNGHDINIIRDQNYFMNLYLNSTSQDKYIGSYTNKLTNEYNTYVRGLAISGYQNLGYEVYPFRDKLEYSDTELEDLNLKFIEDPNFKEKFDRTSISEPAEYQEFYVGEILKTQGINQRNDVVYHQNGEIFRIESLTKKEYNITIETQSANIYSPAELTEYSFWYWEIYDTDKKMINIVAAESTQQFEAIKSALYQEAIKKTGTKRFLKFMKFKEKFTKVSYLFASTLHKLQGKTCEELYLDIRDLDRYYPNQPLTVYKLMYVALTRPTTKINILI